MSEHTPGPWRDETVTTAQAERMRGPLPQDALIIGNDSTCIGVLYDFAERTRPNACLVAAAPDLKAALEAILNLEEIDGVGGGRIRISLDLRSPVAEQARAALVKAEGR